MKYHAFYVDGNLLIRMINKETTGYDKKENIVVLYNNDEIIGYNIFDFEFGDLKPGKVKITKEVNDEINKYLKKIDHCELEIDDKDYFVVGYVKEIKDHPDSNKLKITQVDLGDETVQIVCGAKNIASDIRVVVAKIGAVLDSGLWVVPNKLMNQDSYGMICNVVELGLADKSDGILILDDTYEIGAAFFDEN